MYKIQFTLQAFSVYSSISGEEIVRINKSLSVIKKHPFTGTSLWGNTGLYLFQFADELKFVYRVSGNNIQIISITTRTSNIKEQKEKVSAVIMAAGQDCYINTPMPLVPINGTPLINRITDSFTMAGINDIIVVLGYEAERIKEKLRDKNVKVVINPDYKEGLSRTLRSGLRLVSDDTSAVAVTLGNRPFITPQVISSLVATYKKEKMPITAPTFNNIVGHPVIFDTGLLPELMKVRGNSGGKNIIQRHINELKQIAVSDDGVIKHKL